MPEYIYPPFESQKILEYALDIICALDGNGIVIQINQTFTHILGYPQDFILGNRFISLLHPDDFESTKDIGRANRQGEPVMNFVNRYRHQNGKYISLSWCSLWSEETKLFYAIARDVTDIQLQRQKLIEQQRALNGTIDLLTRQNQQLKSFQHMLTHNLISNSLKYKKPDGPLLISISVYYNDEQDVHILKYQDNGIGIDMDRYGSDIFGLYKTFTDHPDAHGVGLLLVKTQLNHKKPASARKAAKGKVLLSPSLFRFTKFNYWRYAHYLIIFEI